LHREGPHAARRAGYQHFLARLDPPVLAQALQGGLAGQGDYGRLFEGEVRRLGRQLALRSAGVLGEGALAGAEHFLAGLEPGHLVADRRHDPGHSRVHAYPHLAAGDLGLADVPELERIR
jgi:hypothetical protein